MAGSLDIPLKILSLLDGDLEKRFSRGLIGRRQLEYYRKYAPLLNEQPQTLLDKPFWMQLSAEDYDVIVLELNTNLIDQLYHSLTDRNFSGIWSEPAWSQIHGATAIVLSDSSQENIERAIHLGFDGVWTKPLEEHTVLDKLQTAVANARRRQYRQERFNRMRHLCRKVNRNRRHLRHKVDLLCRDLINSNAQFTNTLLDLKRAYDFQSNLTGEFDRRYLMYKALQGTKNTLGDCNSALYLCQSGQFEAHVTGLTQDANEDITTVEELFSTTIVPTVLDSEQIMMLNNSEGSTQLTPNKKWLLKNWTILALPVINHDHLLGVLVFYRHHNKQFTASEQDKLIPMMPPLAQALSSLSKLEQYIHTQ
ncbi:MAG: GAF domain-containing protein [Planctomycetes bacterium]|nr:GAF domain-containing protein [Planctomycetota bacterium]